MAVLLLSACGLDSESRLARGWDAYNGGEYTAAAIDARQVLQADANNADARLLLARAALKLGDLESAQKEFERAFELGSDRSVVIVDWGTLLLQQRRYQELIDTVEPGQASDPDDQRSVTRIRAQAFLGIGDSAGARDIFQQLLALDPNDRDAMLGVVSSYLEEEQFVQARATLDEVRGAHPDFNRALLMSAAMHLVQGDVTTAEAEYLRAADLAVEQSSPADEAAALKGLVEARLQAQNAEAAAEALARLVSFAPNDLGTQFLLGRLSYAQEDWAAAQDALQFVLRLNSKFRPAQVLLGAVHLRQGNLGQAEMYLSAALAAAPDNNDARELLAETRIQQNKADLAEAVLQPLITGDQTDQRALALAARASLSAGNFTTATELLRQRIEQEPDNDALKLDLAAVQIATGDTVAARALLDGASIESEADVFRQQMLYILIHIRGGEFDSAAQRAAELSDKYPDNILLLNTRGGIALAAEDYATARRHFDAALALDAADRTTLMNLGRTAIAQRNFDAARSRFSQVLDLSPADADAMAALAMLAAADGDGEQSLEWLEKARETDPNHMSSRLMLARHHINQRDYAEAHKYAEEAVRINPTSADAYAARGGAEEGRGDFPRAIDSYRRAADLEPENAQHRLNLARAQLLSGQGSSADDTLNAINQQRTGSLRLAMQLAMLKARSGDIDTAVELARDLQRRFPKSELPNVLLGELYFNSGNKAEGAAQFEQALEKNTTLQIAARAYLLRKAHDIGNAELPIVRFLEDNPDNERGRLTLAQHWQESGRTDAAIRDYEAILQANPRNFTALNNLAWLLFTAGDDRAESFARRAYAAAPENANVADTLGWILIQKGSIDEGTEMLREADRLGGGKDVQFHLAVALIEAGNRGEARELLEQLLAGNDEFAERSNAESLLRNL